MWRKTNLKIWLTIVAFLLVMSTAVAAGGTIYVDDSAGGANNGTTWADAYNYLQDGLADPCLVPGSEIWVAQGTYRPDEDTANPGGTGSRTTTFQLKNYVVIKGGYAGYGEPDPNERVIDTYETILSGDLNADDVGFTNNGENSYHVVTGSGTDTTAVLDGFTVTAGNANGTHGNPDADGAGMFNETGSPRVLNCTFSGNKARYAGSGMRNQKGSSPALINCAFSGNSAGVGGAMSNWNNSSPTLTNCCFKRNRADGITAYDGYGGAMSNWTNCNPALTNCTFSGNLASKYGGGVFNMSNSNPTLTNCILWGDTPTEIYVYESTVAITYSDVQGGWPGEGNINANPLFVIGPLGDYYLSQTAAGQISNSQCVDAGSDMAANLGMDQLTTRTDQQADQGIVDMGYHYPIIPNLPDLKIETWGPGRVSPGATINAMIEYRNQGPTPAENVVVVYRLPPQLKYLSSIGGGIYTSEYHEVIWNLGTLPPTSHGYISARLMVVYGLPGGTQFENTAIIMWRWIVIDLATHTMLVLEARDPNRKVGPDGRVVPMQKLNYKVECENEGQGIAFGVYFTDTLDEDLDDSTLEIGPVKDTNDASILAPPGTYDPATRTITWLVGEVGPQEGRYAEFSANVTEDVPHGTDIINFATVYFPSVPEETRTNGVVSTVAPADLHYDGIVNFLDFAILASQWFQSPSHPSADIAPPPDGDGMVNFLDLALLAKHWLTGP